MPGNLKHFLLVPFNAGSTDLKWLEHRLTFFRAFTVPSIKHQTNKNFIPIFLIDPRSPDEIKKELRALGLCYETTSMWAAQRDAEEEVNNDFSRFVEVQCFPGDWVITSRCDNDDALGREYIEVVQDLFREHEEYIIFPYGLMWVGGKYYEKKTVSPPFGTMIEKFDRPLKTVFHINHGSIPIYSKGNYQDYRAGLMWIHAYHGRNLATRPKKLGREYSVSEVTGMFAVEEKWLK